MDQKQLAEEFRINSPRLRAFVFRLTANKADAEDIVQDTYIKAQRNLDTFKGKSSLKTWLFAIASNLAKDHLRARKRWPVNAMDLGKEETMSDPDRYMPEFFKANHSVHGAFELREHIDFCFTCISKTLPVEQQMVVLLKEVFDFKVREIMEILKMTEGSVKHALLNGRNTMRDIFDERCSLVNKNGVCHQCSELNGIFNPKQKFQEEKLRMTFDIRMGIARAIDPFKCNGRDLHFFHFDHIARTLDQKAQQ